MFFSVNAIRPQRKARTREAIGEIRHVFLDADRDGPSILATIAARRDLPPPSSVVHSSPSRLHVLWRVSGFAKEGVEALQKRLAMELGTDKAATSCAQVTRLPGFFNHKYRPAPFVTVEYGAGDAAPNLELRRGQPLGDDPGGASLLERQLRVAMEIPPQRHQVVVSSIDILGPFGRGRNGRALRACSRECVRP